MRWFSRRPFSFDTRVRSYFAFLPVTAGNETRWLEWVTVREEYFEAADYRVWVPKEFLDPPGTPNPTRTDD